MAKSKEDGHKRREKRVADTLLFPDESVVISATPGRLSTIPKYIVTLGLYEFWRRRNTAVITDQRILFGSGIISRSEKSISLAKVLDVGFSRRGLNSYADVTVTDSGQRKHRFVGPMSGKAARGFVREIIRRT